MNRPFNLHSGIGPNTKIMEEPEVTFLFQFGLIRDTVSVAVSTLTLKTLKELACDFINRKVRHVTGFQRPVYIIARSSRVIRTRCRIAIFRVRIFPTVEGLDSS